MQTFLIATILILTIALIIHLLRKQQQRVMRESADRSAPLQPMDFRYEPSANSSEASEDALYETGNWQSSIKELREAGEFEKALILCRQFHPRIQAYQQSLVTLRAMIRDDINHQRNPAENLRELYRYAALADLFQSQSSYHEQLRKISLPGSLAAEAHETFDLPYPHLGYRYLKMLNKTDIRQLRQAWGEPEHHQHTEAFLGQAWSDMIARHSR